MQVAVMLAAIMLTAQVFGQETPARGVGLPQDWSTRHVIFTNGGSPATAALAARDPRAWLQWARRTSAQLSRRTSDAQLEGGEAGYASLMASGWRPPVPDFSLNSRIDWAVSLGPSGGTPVGQAPAKFSFHLDETPDCRNDFVVFVVNVVAKAGRQANVVALNNLYSGSSTKRCGSEPSFLWSYAVGNGAIALSPVLSLDGKKVAMVEAASPRPTFDVLTWVRGQGRNATSGAVAAGADGSRLTRLDFTNIPVAGCAAHPAAGDTNSSPFIDYDADAAYVGADNGILYRIRGVFHGTPALDYCITVAAGRHLSAPVFDFVSGKVFVSDGQSVYAFTPEEEAFTPAGSVRIAGRANSIVESPIVDSTNGLVYVFANHDLSNTHAVASQMPVSLDWHVDAVIGPATTVPILAGDFDNNYYEIGPSAGMLYACGTQPGASTKPALYGFRFGSGARRLSPTPAMAANRKINGSSNPAGMCSPLQEFFDGTTDRLFAGVGEVGSTTGANRVSMWNISHRLSSNAAAPAAFTSNQLGGSSAFAMDGVNPVAGASSIYFGTLAKGTGAPCGVNAFCVVKVTQQVR